MNAYIASQIQQQFKHIPREDEPDRSPTPGVSAWHSRQYKDSELQHYVPLPAQAIESLHHERDKNTIRHLIHLPCTLLTPLAAAPLP